MIDYILKKISLNNKYLLLIYLIFILSFFSLWGSDNINIRTPEHFESPQCPKKYLDKLRKIAKSDGIINGNINDIETDYEVNKIDIKKNKSGSIAYSGKYPKESNYNFSVKSISGDYEKIKY